jgi:hypothetical protein
MANCCEHDSETLGFIQTQGIALKIHISSLKICQDTNPLKRGVKPTPEM